MFFLLLEVVGIINKKLKIVEIDNNKIRVSLIDLFFYLVILEIGCLVGIRRWKDW